MSENLDPLLLDLVEWCAAGPRPYAEIIDAWRTSCPRLTVWEEAMDRGLLVRQRDSVRGALVAMTVEGRAFLAEHGRGKRKSSTEACDPGG